MNERVIDTLTELTAINSPSGSAERAIDYVKKRVELSGYTTHITNKGGLLIEVKGDNDEKKKCITAHVDTLGAMVKEILKDGRLRLALIGGFRYNAIEGEYCTIETATGQTYRGTILIHETTPHVYRNNHEIVRDETNMEVRIDEKVTSEAETRALGIEVGDFVSFDPRTEVTASGFVKSRFWNGIKNNRSGSLIQFSFIFLIMKKLVTVRTQILIQKSKNLSLLIWAH